MTKRTQVLIVGAGPVGLALAGDLGWRGIDALLVEQTDGSVLQPKMDMVGVRTMEFCRRWGIVPWVESAGYNRDYIQDCAWVENLNGSEFGRERFPSPRQDRIPPQSPQKKERCPQNFFDPVLKRFAASTGHTEFRYGTEFVGLEDLGDRVMVTLRNLGSNELETVEAGFVVGTDGGASSVRSALGIGMDGEGVLTYTTNAIFRCDNLESLHSADPAYRYIFIGPQGTWATLVAINGRDEWRFSLIGSDEKRKMTEPEMRAAIVRAVGRDFDFEILSMVPWVRRQLVANSYRKGRVFIAGDAAHLTSPTGGFGMNTGILDSVNLSWKLAGFLEGWAGEELLNSYETEQRPVAIRNVNEAGDNLKRMLEPRLAQPDPRIFSGTGDDAQAARREFGDRYTAAMSREWHTIGIHLGYTYEGSPVIFPDGTPAPEDAVTTYQQKARPGSRAPHVRLGQDRSILDEFGREFVLLRFGSAAPEAAPLVAAARQAGLPLRVVDVDNAEAAAIYERKLVLVRPDGQVAWRSDELPRSPRNLVDVVRGAAPQHAEPAPVLMGSK